MKKSLKLTLSLILLLPLLSNAQEKDFLPDFLPPSPTAYELGKYGQIPVGMITGTPNINIPLYEYKTKNLSVPISLSYNSNGIKVDQIETNVGLSWSLNVGGVISRIVRDTPDEEGNMLFVPEENMHNIFNPNTIQFFYNLGNSNDIVDTETDLFMFNFAGKSGKFVIDKDKKIVLIPYQDLFINYCNNDNLEGGFSITTADGIKYIFNARETSKSSISGHGGQGGPVPTAWYLSKIVHPNGDEIYFEYESSCYSYTVSNSETLKVLDPPTQSACDEWVTPVALFNKVSNILIVYGKKLISISSNNPLNGTISFESNITSNSDLTGSFKLLSNIFVKDKNQNLIENFRFDYLNNLQNKRVFLNKITCKDPSKSYQFNYNNPDNFVNRLSNSQDHWGYYNGKSNCHLVPKLSDYLAFMYSSQLADRNPDWNYAIKGLLSKITYPTKGYTQFDYEPNTVYGTKRIMGNISEVSLSVQAQDEIESNSSAEQIFTIPYEQEIYLNVIIAADENNPLPSTDKEKVIISLIKTDDPSFTPKFEIPCGQIGEIRCETPFSSIGPDDEHKSAYVKLGPGTYKLKISLSWIWSYSTVSFTYYSTAYQDVPDNIETGGLRIKRMISHDPVTNKDNITRYYYGSKDNIEISSGDPGAKESYVSISKDVGYCTLGQYGVIPYETTYAILSSSSLTPLFNAGNNNIYYKYITVSHGGDNFEKGGEEHEFIIDRDMPGNPIGPYTIPIKSAPLCNIGWDHGLESKGIWFKKDGNGNIITLKEVKNSYKQDVRHEDVVNGYSVRKRYDQILQANPIYQCTAEDITKKYTYTYCANNNPDHHHSWLIRLNGDVVCINLLYGGPDMRSGEIEGPCYGKNAGDIIVNPQSIDNLDIMEYSNYSYWTYMDKTTVKQYDQNGANPITTETNFYYDNANHLQLTRTETTGSNGEVLKSIVQYPMDGFPGGLPANSSNPNYTPENLAVQNMIENHILNKPLKSVQMVNDNVVSGSIYNYRLWPDQNGIVLPYQLYSWEKDNGYNLKDTYTFANGNLLMDQKPDGYSTAYI